MRLIWTPDALRDIARLHRFLATKDRAAAGRAVAAIRGGVRLLTGHPEVGRPVDDMPPEFREWPVAFGAGGYLVLYRLDGRSVVILAVRHGREFGY